MKLLKIFSAVLFFSFLGSMQNQLLAQGPEGSWTTKFSVGDSLVNGDFKVKFVDSPKSDELIITKNNTFFRRYIIIEKESGKKIGSLSFKKDSAGEPVGFSKDFLPQYGRIIPISLKSRHNSNEKVMNTTEEVTDSAFLQLEDDGFLNIYSGTGGVPIVQLICQRY
jgi:hypothetical protein